MTSLAFHPRFNWLATGAWGEDVIVLWDLDRKERMRVIRDQRGGGVNSVAFSSDGKWLAAGYRDGGKIELWRVSDRAPYLAHAREISGHEGTWVHVVAFNKSADLLATGGKDNRILLWDVSTGERAGALEGHRAWISDLDFTPDGALLTRPDNTLMLWDVAARNDQPASSRPPRPRQKRLGGAARRQQDPVCGRGRETPPLDNSAARIPYGPGAGR